jgi:NAD(P)-dependent dehydrogenase (short-subunit alcohol dehydrogenase family)
VAALGLAPHGIRVHTIAPDPIDAAMMQPGFWGEIDLCPLLAKATPMGRAGQLGGDGTSLCWLASDDSSYGTGADFAIVGGIPAGPSPPPPHEPSPMAAPATDVVSGRFPFAVSTSRLSQS